MQLNCKLDHKAWHKFPNYPSVHFQNNMLSKEKNTSMQTIGCDKYIFLFPISCCHVSGFQSNQK